MPYPVEELIKLHKPVSCWRIALAGNKPGIKAINTPKILGTNYKLDEATFFIPAVVVRSKEFFYWSFHNLLVVETSLGQEVSHHIYQPLRLAGYDTRSFF